MSHAQGEVIQNNKVIAYFEYNGTVDIAISALWDTEEEVTSHWRSNIWNDCTCEQEPEEVLLFTKYGRGFHWPAKVCFNCRAITEGLSLEDVFEWDDRGSDRQIWPKDGHPLKR